MHTHSDLWQVEANGLGETPRVRDKAAPTGEVTYSTGCVLRILRKEDKLGSDKAASVNVINPAAIYELGVIYRAQGRIYVQPWGSNGRMTLSLTVEGLVPADERSVDATGGGRTIGVQTSLGRRFGTIGDGTRRNWPGSTKTWSRMSIWRRRPTTGLPVLLRR